MAGRCANQKGSLFHNPPLPYISFKLFRKPKKSGKLSAWNYLVIEVEIFRMLNAFQSIEFIIYFLVIFQWTGVAKKSLEMGNLILVGEDFL